MDWQFRSDQLAPAVFIARGAIVLGDVTLGAAVSIWFNAVVRGDAERIVVGADSNVQDQCVLHADPGYPCLVGERVTIGHAAIVHGATIEDDVMIGMRAVILNGARIGTGSIVGAGAVVTEGAVIPPHSLVLGMPARVKRPTNPTDMDRIRHAAEHYVAAARAAAPHWANGPG